MAGRSREARDRVCSHSGIGWPEEERASMRSRERGWSAAVKKESAVPVLPARP